jgi:hypothetical protein
MPIHVGQAGPCNAWDCESSSTFSGGEFQMHHRTKRIVAIVGSIAAVCWIAVFATGTAHAGKNETVVGWLGADANATWVTVEVIQPGRGRDTTRLKSETKATFGIQLSGTGFDTTVLIDGQAGELSEIPEGERVHIVWRPVEGSDYEMFATKIVYLTEAAIEARKSEATNSEDSKE